jgi:hypothetical protein
MSYCLATIFFAQLSYEYMDGAGAMLTGMEGVEVFSGRG